MSKINLLETTDASIWAAEFCRIKKEKGWSVSDIDEGLMIGWFANMWAATHDPLSRQVDRLTTQVSELQAEVERLRGIIIESELHDSACGIGDTQSIHPDAVGECDCYLKEWIARDLLRKEG